MRAQAHSLRDADGLRPDEPARIRQLQRLELRRAAEHRPLAAGLLHSLMVDSSGTALSCGREDDPWDSEFIAVCVLGRGSIPGPSRDDPPEDEGMVLVPVRPLAPVHGMEGVRVISVSANVEHSLALDSAGRVYSWGKGRQGKLGHGDWANQHTPRLVESLLVACNRCISAGSSHSAAIDSHGGLYTWGGHSGREDAGLGYEMGMEMDDGQNTPRSLMRGELEGLRLATAAAGDGFTVACTEGGLLFTFGSNGNGQLGLGEPVSRAVQPRWVRALRSYAVIAVAAGDGRGLAVTDDGELFCLGRSLQVAYGFSLGYIQLLAHYASLPARVPGLDGERVVAVAISIRTSHRMFCAVTERGGLFSWGSGLATPGHETEHQAVDIPRRVEALAGVRLLDVSVGSRHALALGEDGAVYGWGDASGGRIGLDRGEGPDGAIPEGRGAPYAAENVPRRIPGVRVHCPQWPERL